MDMHESQLKVVATEPKKWVSEAHALLVRADEILADETKWTKGHGARDAKGYMIGVRSQEACSFCVVGALARARAQLSGHSGVVTPENMLCEELQDILELDEDQRIKHHAVMHVNDLPQTTFAHVKEAFRRVRAKMEQK